MAVPPHPPLGRSFIFIEKLKNIWAVGLWLSAVVADIDPPAQVHTSTEDSVGLGGDDGDQGSSCAGRQIDGALNLRNA